MAVCLESEFFAVQRIAAAACVLQNDAAEVKDDVKADNFDFALRHRRDMGKAIAFNINGRVFFQTLYSNKTDVAF